MALRHCNWGWLVLVSTSVHVSTAVRSFTQAGNLAILRLVRVKFVVIPVDEGKIEGSERRQFGGRLSFIVIYDAIESSFFSCVNQSEEDRVMKQYVSSSPAETSLLAIRII